MFFYYYGDVRTHLPSDVPRLDDFSDVGSPLKAEYLATRERFGHQGKIIQLKVGRARSGGREIFFGGKKGERNLRAQRAMELTLGSNSLSNFLYLLPTPTSFHL